MSDPCLSCRLPDCDETHADCALLRMRASYRAKQRRGDLASATEAERIAIGRYRADWKIARRIEAAAGGRSFTR